MSDTPMKIPETKEEAKALLRSYLNEQLPAAVFEQACIDLAGKPQEQIAAELGDSARELVRLMKERRGEDGWPSDAICVVFPFVFAEMVRERMAVMPSPGKA